MTQQDGEKLFNTINDFLNTEMTAGNRITKYSASAFGNAIGEIINKIIEKDKPKTDNKATKPEIVK